MALIQKAQDEREEAPEQEAPDQPEEQAEQPPAKPEPKGAALPDKVTQVFQRLLLAAMKLIYADRNVTGQMVEMVKSAPDPVTGIVNATKAVVGQVAARAKGINPEVVQRIAGPVATLITELAVRAGVAQESPELVSDVLAALKGGGQPQQSEQEPSQAPAPQEQPQGGLVASAMGA